MDWPSFSLSSWAIMEIQQWIADRANKLICTQAIGNKSTSTSTTNHNFPMQGCTKFRLILICLPWIFHLLRYSLSSMYTSVLDKGGVFTEQRSSVSSFVTATSNNGCYSKANLSTETKSRFSSSLWIRKHDDTQGLLIGAFIHRLPR